jgi:drug/metabolite transporter (DMT)-like permease
VIFSEDLRALGGPRVAFAAGCVLIAPIAAALASVAVKRWGKDVHPLSISAMPMGIAAVVLGSLAFTFERGRTVEWTGASIGALLYLALFGSALSFTLFYWLLARLPATSLSLFNYVTPVVAVLTGRLFLAEPITLRIVLGAALVLAGVAVAVRAGRSRQKAISVPEPEPS